MRCFLDTNILISALLFPSSVPAQAYMKAMTRPHVIVMSDYTIEEMRRVFMRKFPHKLQACEHFLNIISLSVEMVVTPCAPTSESMAGENRIRDINDRPIYRAAVAAKVDAIITGDKDLLDSGITCPVMLTAAQFLQA